jgi:hypothetical protein
LKGQKDWRGPGKEASRDKRKKLRKKSKKKNKKTKLKNDRHEHAWCGILRIGLNRRRFRADDSVSSRARSAARHNLIRRRQRAAGGNRMCHTRNRNAAGVNHFSRNADRGRAGRSLRTMHCAKSGKRGQNENNRDACEMGHEKKSRSKIIKVRLAKTTVDQFITVYDWLSQSLCPKNSNYLLILW